MKKYVLLIIIFIMICQFGYCNEVEPAIKLTTTASEVTFYIIISSPVQLDWGDNTIGIIAESGEYYHKYDENDVHEVIIGPNNVHAFICNNQQITKLDVSNATRLKTLECKGNQITELDLSQNTQLQSLDYSENQIAKVDVSQLPDLIRENADGKDVVQEETLTDIVGTKYQIAVKELVNKKIFSGYPDGTFLPEKTITRAEIVTVVTKLNNIEVITDYELEFNDIAEHWGKGFISTLAAKGFVTGYGNGEFRPDNNVTYAEVGAMVLNSLGYKDEVLAMDIGWPNNYVEKSRELGLYKDITVTNPDNKMTRGEVAIFVYNVMNSDLMD